MQPEKPKNLNDHLANERTFLAWLRTGIGVMVFGFVVVKFSLFLKQFSLIFGNQNIIHKKSYSAEIGILLVVFGLIISIFGYFRYKKTEKQINEDSFKNNSFLIGLSTIILIVFNLDSHLVFDYQRRILCEIIKPFFWLLPKEYPFLLKAFLQG